MGKWNALLVSLIPAILAGYLCYLMVTVGLAIPDDKMGMMFWGPLGAGFIACVMAMLTPFGIAIFVQSAPKATSAQKSDDGFGDDGFEDNGDALDSNEFESDGLSDSEFASDDALSDSDFASDGDLEDADFDSDDFSDEASSDFQTAEFSDSDFEDDLGDEFDAFGDDDDDELDLLS